MGFSVKDYIARQNYTLLKNKHPEILTKLEQEVVVPTGEVVCHPGNHPNLKIEQGQNIVWIHPENNPKADEDYFLGRIKADFSGVEILFGMGLGYGVKAVLKKRKSIRFLIVVENDPGIFIQALKYMDLTDILDDPKVILGIAPESAEEFMGPANKALSFESTQILEHPKIAALEKNVYGSVYSMVYDYANVFNITGATKIRYGKKIVRNRFDHLKSMGHYYLFEKLVGKLSGVPAYIAAAGPSLDQCLPFLKKVQNKAVLICVDTALPSFIEHGIQPDFVTSIDYKDDTFEKMAHRITEVSEKTGLFVYSWTSPKVVKNFPGNRKFFLLTETGIDTWMKSLINGDKFFASSSSVANLNFIAAKVLGCSPIVFLGQDLAYGSGASHSKGAVLTVRDKITESLETGADIVFVDGVQGGKVPTTRGMKNALDIFEGLIEHNPGEYINCSTGGAHIKGTTYMPMEEAVKTFYSDEVAVGREIDLVCRPENRIDPHHIISQVAKDKKNIDGLLLKIKKTERLLKNGQKQVPSIRKNWNKNSRLPKKMFSLLKQIDALNAQIDNYEGIWQALEDATSQGLKKSEEMAFEIQKIEGNIQKYPEWLEKTINRLEYINDVRKEMVEFLVQGVRDISRHLSDERQLLEKFPTQNMDIIGALAELYITNKDFALAVPYVDQYLGHYPESGRANFFAGCLKAQENAVVQMNSFFDKALELDTGLADRVRAFRMESGDFYVESAEHFIDYDLEVTRRLLLKAWYYCPFHRKIPEMLTELMTRDLEKIVQADEKNMLDKEKIRIESWVNSLNENPQIHGFLKGEQLSRLLYFMGKVKFTDKEKEEAIVCFNKSLTYSPNDVGLCLKLANLFLSSFEYEQGVPYLNRAIKLDSSSAQYWEGFGEKLMQSGRFDEAVTAFEQALQFFPEKIELYHKMAECCLNKGNQLHQNGEYESAANVYSTAIGFSPDTTPCLIHLYNNCGSALKNLGKHEVALNYYDKALEIDPGYAEALYNKGEFFQTRGDMETALEYYQKSIKANPDFKIARQKIQAILPAMGREDQ